MKNNTRKILLALLLVFTMLVGMFAVTSFAEEATEGTEAETKTYYFSNSQNWSEVYFYAWTDGVENSQNAEWPGVAATYVGQNGFNQSIYSAEVSVEASHLIFNNNNNGQQTVDIALSSVEAGKDGFWADKQEGEKWTVGYYTFSTNDITSTDKPADSGNNGSTATPDSSGLQLAVGDYYLCGYLNGVDYGIEADSANRGEHKFVDGKLTMIFTEDSYVVIKNSDNVTYFTQSYVDGPKSATYHNSSTGAHEKMKVPAGRVDFTLYKGEGDTFVLEYEGGAATGGTEGDPANAPKWDEYDTVKIYFGNGKEWLVPKVHCWYRGEDGLDYAYTIWPGLEFEIDDNNYYYVEIPSVCNYIIFSNDGNDQTSNLELPAGENNLYDIVAGKWVKKDTYTPSAPPSDTDRDVTVAVKNTANWEQVWCYYWALGDVSSVTWPGVEMELGADGLYYCTIPEGNFYVIFNNGLAEGASQTANLKIPTDDNVLFDNATNEWSYLKLDANHPADGNPNTPGGDQSGNGDSTGAPKMTFLQKMAKALLLFLRKMEDTFKNLFKFKK